MHFTLNQYTQFMTFIHESLILLEADRLDSRALDVLDVNLSLASDLLSTSELYLQQSEVSVNDHSVGVARDLLEYALSCIYSASKSIN